ncbi:MAG: hypothetical protein HZB13_00815 [Acidobacteria bacterium]|nr:hypothetical protein [Acidobacteriota bacterium]
MAEPGVHGAALAAEEDAETFGVGAPEGVGGAEPVEGTVGVTGETGVGGEGEVVLEGVVLADEGAEEFDLLIMVAGERVRELGGLAAGFIEDGGGLKWGEGVLAGVDAMAAGVLGAAELAAEGTGAGGLEGIGAIGGELPGGHFQQSHGSNSLWARGADYGGGIHHGSSESDGGERRMAVSG